MELYNALDAGKKYNSISKEMYDESPSLRSFKKLKASTYDKLIDSFIHINKGNPLQKEISKLTREYVAIKLMVLFGLQKPVILASRRLLKKCIKYHRHSFASDVANEASRLYALNRDKTRALEFHNIALKHSEIFRLEILFDWEFELIRGRYGTEAFFQSADDMSALLNRLKPHFDSSIRIQLYYYELSFFIAYIQEDVSKQIAISQQALDHFRSLSFNHSAVINVFTFHLLDVLITSDDLARAELIILASLEDKGSLGSHNYRYHELLFQIYLFRGQVSKANSIFQWLERKVKKCNFPKYVERFQLYTLYMALLTGEEISLKKLHYNLNKIKRENIQIILPFLIGKVVYYFQRESLTKAELELTHLMNYSKLYLDKSIHDRSIAFVRQLHNLFDVRSLPEFKLPKKSAILGRDNVEILEYEKLLDLVEVQSF